MFSPKCEEIYFQSKKYSLKYEGIYFKPKKYSLKCEGIYFQSKMFSLNYEGKLCMVCDGANLIQGIIKQNGNSLPEYFLS